MEDLLDGWGREVENLGTSMARSGSGVLAVLSDILRILDLGPGIEGLHPRWYNAKVEDAGKDEDEAGA